MTTAEIGIAWLILGGKAVCTADQASGHGLMSRHLHEQLPFFAHLKKK